MLEILLAQRRIDEAAKIVDVILKERPQDRDALSARAILLLESGRQEELAQAIQEI